MRPAEWIRSFMNDLNNRDSRRKKELRRKKRQQKIAAAIMGAVLIVLLCTVIFLMILKQAGKTLPAVSSSETSSSAAESAVSAPLSESPVSEAAASGAAVSEPGTSSSVSGSASAASEKISLTQDQIHTGNLILVNSDYPYDFEKNEDSIGLVNILSAQSFSYPVAKEEFQVAGRIMSSLDQLIAACDAAVGTKVTGISSAYRSKEYQQQVWNEAAQQYGEAYAKEYVAVPGYSEHHTGLAVDFGIIRQDGTEGTFSESENAVWMKDNSYLYGFVRRYAEDKKDITKISNEAWHFRYVGLPHAAYMTQNNLCLEEYLAYLKDNTSEANPLIVNCTAGSFSIYYTSAREITKPEGSYEISGNNIDGYIITAVL